MYADRRVRAVVNLDGAVYGPVVQAGLDRPVLLMDTPIHDGLAQDYTWVEFWPHLRGWRRCLRLADADHLSYTDIMLMPSQVGMPPGAWNNRDHRPRTSRVRGTRHRPRLLRRPPAPPPGPVAPAGRRRPGLPGDQSDGMRHGTKAGTSVAALAVATLCGVPAAGRGSDTGSTGTPDPRKPEDTWRP